jgi:hypothetical protein
VRVNKFNARKAHCSAGHEHDSVREAKRCNYLRILERTGEIADLRFQPQYWFDLDGRPLKHDNGRRIGYKADFSYREPGGAHVVEDAKPPIAAARGRDWPIRKALFRHCFPYLELREV